MNIGLLRPADFNEKLREHKIDKRLTIQKICRVCKDENEVRDALDSVWNEPMKMEELLFNYFCKNQNVYEFEKALAN